MRVDKRTDVGGPLRILLFAALPAARDKVLQAAHPVLPFVQSLRDRLAPPAEASLGWAGAAAAQRRDHLGLEQAALGSGEVSGPRSDQVVILFHGVVHHSGPAQGETMTERPDQEVRLIREG